MDLSSGSAKGEFDYLHTYLTLPSGCTFFSRHENDCDKTTSLSLLLFTFCHLNQLGIVVLVQLQIYLPTYLPPTIASKKLPPQILHPPRPSTLLASPLSPPQQSFFSSLPTKKTVGK